MTDFKAGDKVEFVSDYNMGKIQPGDTATVTGVRDLVSVDVTSGAFKGQSTECYDFRLKLAEETKPRELQVGDKVRFIGRNEDWKGVEGILEGLKGENGNCNHKPKPFTYEDIQVGDTIRRTRTYTSGAKEVREGVVGRQAYDYVAADTDNMFILAYASDDNLEVVTLELLNRPEPEPVKEPWEDAKPGDRLVVKNAAGIVRVLTKQEGGQWDTLVIGSEGNGHLGFGRSTEVVKRQLTQPTFNAGKLQFLKA